MLLVFMTLMTSPALATEPVDLNSADAGAFVDLGLESGLADSLVALRGERGRLGSVEELRVLPGMDEGSLDTLRRGTSITVDLAVQNSPTRYNTVGEVLGQFAHEPTIAQVQQLAMEYTHTHRSQVERWLEASRNAAWLPEFQLRYYYYDRLNSGYDYEADDEGFIEAIQTDADSDKDHVYQATFKWRLDDLMMSSERIRVISEAQDVVKLRDKVLGEVTRIYFDRRRLQVDNLLAPSSDIRSQVEDQLRLMELTAELDAYTGGQFSRNVSSN